MCLAFIHRPRHHPRNHPRHHPRQIARRCLPGAWRNAHRTRPASRPRPRTPRPAPMRRRNVGSASTTFTARHRGMGGRWRRREDCFLGPHPRPPPLLLVAQVGGSMRAPTLHGTMTGNATMAGQELRTTPVPQATTAPIVAEADYSRPPRLRYPRHHPRRPRPPFRRPRPHFRRAHRLRRPVQTAPISWTAAMCTLTALPCFAPSTERARSNAIPMKTRRSTARSHAAHARAFA